MRIDEKKEAGGGKSREIMRALKGELLIEQGALLSLRQRQQRKFGRAERRIIITGAGKVGLGLVAQRKAPRRKRRGACQSWRRAHECGGKVPAKQMQ